MSFDFYYTYHKTSPNALSYIMSLSITLYEDNLEDDADNTKDDLRDREIQHPLGKVVLLFVTPSFSRVLYHR